MNFAQLNNDSPGLDDSRYLQKNVIERRSNSPLRIRPVSADIENYSNDTLPVFKNIN